MTDDSRPVVTAAGADLEGLGQQPTAGPALRIERQSVGKLAAGANGKRNAHERTTRR